MELHCLWKLHGQRSVTWGKADPCGWRLLENRSKRNCNVRVTAGVSMQRRICSRGSVPNHLRHRIQRSTVCRVHDHRRDKIWRHRKLSVSSMTRSNSEHHSIDWTDAYCCYFYCSFDSCQLEKDSWKPEVNIDENNDELFANHHGHTIIQLKVP